MEVAATAPALPSGELLWPSGKNSKWPSRIPGIKLASCFILHKVQISPPLIPKGGDFTAKGFLSSCQTKRTHPKIPSISINPSRHGKQAFAFCTHFSMRHSTLEHSSQEPLLWKTIRAVDTIFVAFVSVINSFSKR